MKIRKFDLDIPVVEAEQVTRENALALMEWCDGGFDRDEYGRKHMDRVVVPSANTISPRADPLPGYSQEDWDKGFRYVSGRTTGGIACVGQYIVRLESLSGRCAFLVLHDFEFNALFTRTGGQ